MNGTFVNGSRLDAPYALSVGDAIEMGGTTVVVESLGQTAPAVEPALPEQPDPEAVMTRIEPQPPSDPLPPAGPAPRVSLRIDMDFELGEATVALEDGSDRVRLVYDGGRWRIVADADA
jgi:hypothetical protein